MALQIILKVPLHFTPASLSPPDTSLLLSNYITFQIAAAAHTSGAGAHPGQRCQERRCFSELQQRAAKIIVLKWDRKTQTRCKSSAGRNLL